MLFYIKVNFKKSVSPGIETCSRCQRVIWEETGESKWSFYGTQCMEIAAWRGWKSFVQEGKTTKQSSNLK